MPAKSRKEQIEEMLKDEPNDAELHYMLAMEHVSAGDDARAVEAFERLIALHPGHAAAYHMAGRAMLRLGRSAAARACLQTGAAAAERSGNVHAAGEMRELLDQLSG